MSPGVSVRDVALVAGVSVGTVSNVLNRPDAVREATRGRVLAAIEELGFVRNESARQLRAGSSRAIGMIVIDASNPFFSAMAHGVEDRVAQQGEVILLGNSGGDVDRERRYLGLFEQQRVRGLLISPSSDVPLELSGLRRLGIPVVFIDRESDTNEYSSVGVDDLAGGRMAAEHLLGLGHRRFAFVGGPRTIKQPRERLEGFSEACRAAGGEVDYYETANMTIAEGRRVGQLLGALDPADRPTAVFGANDLAAIGVLNAVRSAGIDVPGELSIVGFDDISFAETATVPLTTVAQPAELMGHEGANLLYEQLQGAEPRQVSFMPHLVIRDSTGPVPAQR